MVRGERLIKFRYSWFSTKPIEVGKIKFKNKGRIILTYDYRGVVRN